MSDTYYDGELAELGNTFFAAMSADIELLKLAIASAAESSIIGVGSGGSFTVASLLCNLHELYTGRVSRPSTPLEIICNPTLAASSPVFMISAEGKNPDIIEVLERARRHSSRTVHVVTNRRSSPLMEHVKELPEVTPHVFELAKKDGYLATNSLLLDAVLIARAYGALHSEAVQFPKSLDGLRIGGQSVQEWLTGAQDFVRQAVPRKGLIVVFSPLLRPVAADLESKLSESALLYSQLADIRSFAHGRHLWLAERAQDCAILALVEPGVERLWARMQELLPSDVPVCTMPLGGGRPQDLLAGLVAQMRLVSLIAAETGKDPAKPLVPSFGRDLYYVDLPSFIPGPEDTGRRGEQSKFEVLGARWPSIGSNGAMSRALASFESALALQPFRAIVFDYDGTLCSSQRKDLPPSAPIVERVIRLLNAGIVVGVASGRGDSIQQHLRDVLPSEVWSKVHLGLYNGGWIGLLDEEIDKAIVTNEFLSHVRRILGRLESLGVPIERVRETYPHQISVRFKEGANAENMWFVIADSLRQAGLDTSTVVRSKHSVDVLAANVNKSHLVANMIQARGIDPYEIVTMGDQGAWPGNDASLLEHRFSLSVDQPSRRLDRGWKLAPHHKRDVDATLWYLDHAKIDPLGGSFRFALGT
ncbi:HAD-superfamily hydrolase, subfamily IIB [Variovorax sp. PDC80]|uniref:HAD-IIB family hydrolase n=1 Tax=Variovorax sp. PDC80 TaxID=1882827 RepID=UPI0008EC9A9F|nr:HAD-IIB family hydrolase [Variovorax sp. PDC80]SFP77103.1 HAD-superfamily hydrolase, subfamily IIB [Variovorax sp. PDC80]